LADWKLMPALIIALLLLCAFFVVFAAAMQVPALAVAGVFLIGLIGFVGGPGLQARSVQQAKDAPLLVSTLNQSAFNLGNAGGAWLGATLLTHGAGYPVLSLAAAGVTAVGLGLTLLSLRMERRAVTEQDLVGAT
jgi:MFS transporter, DHA1 family, inner membrane transport protein